jgi:hypothetical protein
VVVVAAGGEERRLVAQLLLELEAEHVTVEGNRTVEIRDLQMDVTDVGAGVDRFTHVVENASRSPP